MNTYKKIIALLFCLNCILLCVYRSFAVIIAVCLRQRIVKDFHPPPLSVNNALQCGTGESVNLCMKGHP